MYCSVIVDILNENVDRVFTYRVPEHLELLPGMRVHVPFGRIKKIEGIVISLSRTCGLPDGKVREVIDRMEVYPLILPQLMQLAQQISRSSFCPLAKALRLMYPAQMRGERIHALTEEVAFSEVGDGEKTQALDAQKRAPKRLKLLSEVMEAGAEGVPCSRLRAEDPGYRAPLTALCGRGLVRLEKRELRRSPYGSLEQLAGTDPKLLPQQEKVLSQLLPAIDAGEGQFLLYGITGSGKTEIFIRAVRHTASLGKTAVVLVPEIALTPQMVGWFRGRFGEDAAVLHSRLSPGERFDEWRRIRQGKARVVIGARSAIFAPLEDVGLIIIDEEHEQSYQADNSPRYDARELAAWRCRNEKAVLLLASATPSMKSFAMAGRGDLKLLEMPERANGLPLPTVEVVDMREELKRGNRSLFSGKLLDGLSRCLNAGKQAILFVNRRGHSTFVSCRSCGYVVKCAQCDISMTYHSVGNILRCHYCGSEVPVPETCPECGSEYIRYFGVGTQRVEEEVRKFFPGVSVLRMDNDTTRTKDAHEQILNCFRSGEARVLVGTQMIAKGLDFPNVTMVGIIAADAMLKLPDFRSAERTFQLLTQVAGRAGRADTPGEVFLQTYDPENYAVEAARHQDFRSFYEQEMRRRKRTLYPPYTMIARALFESEDEEKAKAAAQNACAEMQRYLEAHPEERKYAVSLRSTVCPVARIKGLFRWHTILKIIDVPAAQPIVGRLTELAETPPEGTEGLLQVNPSGLV